MNIYEPISFWQYVTFHDGTRYLDIEVLDELNRFVDLQNIDWHMILTKVD